MKMLAFLLSVVLSLVFLPSCATTEAAADAGTSDGKEVIVEEEEEYYQETSAVYMPMP